MRVPPLGGNSKGVEPLCVLLNVAYSGVLLNRGGTPRQGELVSPPDALARILADNQQPPCESLRLLVHERIVHEEECLRWHRRGRPLLRGGVRVRAIE